MRESSGTPRSWFVVRIPCYHTAGLIWLHMVGMGDDGRDWYSICPFCDHRQWHDLPPDDLAVTHAADAN